MKGIDESIFHWINGWPGALAPLMSFFSTGMDQAWVRTLLLLVLALLILAGPNTRRAAIQALIAFPFANELTDIFKAVFRSARPFQDTIEVIVRVGMTDSFGTASGHAANMAAVAYVMTRNLGWFGVPWIIIAVLTGLSRIYNGVHYPYQVLLGWACGVLVAFLVELAWRKIRARFFTSKEQLPPSGLPVVAP